MPAYVLLTRLTPDGMKKVLETPDELRNVHKTLKKYETTKGNYEKDSSVQAN